MTLRIWAVLCFAGMAGAPAGAQTLSPRLAPAAEAEWKFPSGRWRLDEGVLEQESTDRLSAAILKGPAFADCRLSVEFNIRGVGKGVRAAALLFRATGTLSYYWLHLDSKNGQAILVRSTPANPWIEIGRKRVPIAPEEWHTATVACAGAQITVELDGAPVFALEEKTLAAGRVGVGTSQGRVAFRALKVEGRPLEGSEPLKEEAPPYKVISRGEAAGPYQAFPDACRLKNGDILCVFYAGYGHISLPNAEWPKGGRICMVRSRDEGRTWSAPAVLYDDADDNRDPHVAQLSDGALICTFFSLIPKEKGYGLVGVQMARSSDGGATWEEKARNVLPGWACSAPVRELPDGTLLQGVYAEGGGKAYGGVLRSTDGGRTWGEAIPIGKDQGLSLDAETDVIRLKDGSLYAALRSSSHNMHCATSADAGRTWSPAKDIGFKGHSPHLNRLSTGEILMTQRLPATALYVSRDEAKTWQGPHRIDSVGGAYPATVELKDGSVLAIYYEEGEGSAIRALRFRLKPDGIEPLPLE